MADVRFRNYAFVSGHHRALTMPSTRELAIDRGLGVVRAVTGSMRIFMIVMLAVLATAAFLVPAHSAAMDTRMVVGGASAHHHVPQHCPDGNDDMSLCGSACALSTLLPYSPALTELSAGGPAFVVAVARDRAGRADPPDPYPPKTMS
jgi:hypothetical protein